MESTTCTHRPVTEAELREQLRRLARERDANEGLFGPRSLMWEVTRHSAVTVFGGLQSVLLQLCHPWIATAVRAHSKVRTQPGRRAQLTYAFMWSLFFGDMPRVAQRATALFRLHARIEGALEDGSAYEANEAHALLWVHVTAYSCRVRLYEELVRPLSEREKDQFVAEIQRLALCFAIPPELHPRSWAETELYLREVIESDTLRRSEPGVELCRFIEAAIPSPLRRALWTLLSAPLPAALRRALDLPEATPAAQRRRRLIVRLLRSLTRLLPAKLRYLPAWHEAQARLRGEEDPGWLVRQLNRRLVGQELLVTSRSAA